MPDRTKVKPTRTLEQFIGRGLCPCNGCLQAAIRCDDSPISGRRVYKCGTSHSFPLGPRTCSCCGFSVCSSGAFEITSDLMREMYRRETKTNSGGPDVTTDVSPRLQSGGGLLMRHGDSKTSFSTGAQRDTDEGKGSPSLISPVLIHRLGILLQKGADHYGADNWTKGMPYRRTADSMIRHLYQWLAGDEEEDHLAAVCFGAMCLMTYEEQWNQSEEEKRIRSDKEYDIKINPLDDRNKNLKKILASILTSLKPKPILKTDENTSSDFVGDRGSEDQSSSTKLTFRKCPSCDGDTFMTEGLCLGCREGYNDETR